MAGQYTRNTWVNGAPPAINDTNLNNVETGVESASRYSRSVVATPSTDADYTLTAAENQYGRIEIDTTNWTTGRNVIMNSNEHTFLAVVTGGQSVTFKNATGVGVIVASGETKQLRNDTIDIIKYEAGLEVATSAEIRAGINNTKAVTSLGINETIFGMGQTWQDVAGSRSVGVTYTNNSGKPIVVHVRAYNSSNSGQFIRLTINGVVLTSSEMDSTTENRFIQCIVPDGQTYRVSTGVGLLVIAQWVELRD